MPATARTAQLTATHKVASTHLEAGDLSTDKGSKGTMNAKLDLGKGGSVALESTFGLDPLMVKAKVDAALLGRLRRVVG